MLQIFKIPVEWYRDLSQLLQFMVVHSVTVLMTMINYSYVPNLIYIYIYIYILKNRKKETLLSLQACFVIAHSSGDFKIP